MASGRPHEISKIRTVRAGDDASVSTAAEDLGRMRIATRVPPGPPQSLPVLCKFYAQGYCANGRACRFYHPPREDEDEQNASGKSDTKQTGEPVRFVRPQISEFVARTDVTAEPSTQDVQRSQDEVAGNSEYVDFASAYGSLFGSSEQEDETTSSQHTTPQFVHYVQDPAEHSYAAKAGSAFTPEDLQVSRTRHWETTITSVPDVPLCNYHMDGTCRYGAGCRYLHGTFCSICQRNVLHPTDNAKAAQHVQECMANADQQERVASSNDVECGICYEKPIARGRKFGLLQNCEHSFCLECIREWRGTDSADAFGREAVRTCPICRIESYMVIPSDVFERDPDAKQEIHDSYTNKLRLIPCRYYAFGDGECPFGTSCLYSHVDRDGNEPDADSALLFNESGARIKTTNTLADFL